MQSEETPRVVDTILASYKSLPDSEKAVADFILKQTSTVSSLTATQIAQQSGTSNTTVSRFVRSIGFSSFSEMRFALAREETSTKDRAFDASQGISTADIPGSMHYILQTKVDELKSTLAGLDVNELGRAVEALASARMVMFVGVGSSLPVAQSAAIKFSQAGVNAVSPSTTDGAQLSAMLMTPEDRLVVVSNSGRSDRLRRVADCALDRGVQIITITRDVDSALARRADIVLPVVARDYLLVNSFDFSHNSINFVLETLLLLLSHSSDGANEYHLRLFNESMAQEKGDAPVKS